MIIDLKNFTLGGYNTNGQAVLYHNAMNSYAYVISKYQRKKIKEGKKIRVQNRQYVTDKSPLLYLSIVG